MYSTPQAFPRRAKLSQRWKADHSSFTALCLDVCHSQPPCGSWGRRYINKKAISKLGDWSMSLWIFCCTCSLQISCDCTLDHVPRNLLESTEYQEKHVIFRYFDADAAAY